jgi:hypothetical protein
MTTSPDQPQQPATPQQPGYSASPPLATPRAPLANPFTGVPGSDIARDVAAALLLFAAMFYQWTAFDDGVDLWFVIIATILAIAGLLPTYLWKMGAFGSQWNPGYDKLIRLAASAPYVLAILAVLVIDLANDTSSGEGFVGPGARLGMVGVILALQPRRHEQAAGASTSEDRTWHAIASGLAVLAVLAYLVSSVADLIDNRDSADVSQTVFFVVTLLMGLAVLALPVAGLVRRSAPWTAVLIGMGALVVLIDLLSFDEAGFVTLLGAHSGAEIESARVAFFGLLFLVGAAAAALSPGVLRITGGLSRRENLVGAAARALLLVALSFATQLVARLGDLVDIIDAQADVPVDVVLALIGFLVIAIVTGAAGFSLLRTPARARMLVLVLAAAGTLALVSIILAIVFAITDGGLGGDLGRPLSWFTPLVIALAVALLALGAGDVRSALGGVVQRFAVPDPAAPKAAATPQPTAPQATAPQAVTPQFSAPEATAPQAQPAAAAPPPAPATPAAAPAAPSAPSTPPDPWIAKASDPATSQAELAELVQQHPHTRPAVAAHPQAYPALLEWLAELGDPAVDAALAQRRG